MFIIALSPSLYLSLFYTYIDISAHYMDVDIMYADVCEASVVLTPQQALGVMGHPLWEGQMLVRHLWC